jgi:3-phenylpropionate/cinnamic acid dioxygenase small subunit
MQSADTPQSAAPAQASPPPGKRIAHGAGVYDEVMDFLIEEAHLLDEGLFNEWLQLLADDVECTMPVRQSVSRQRGPGFDEGMIWFQEDKATLSYKVQRLSGDSAFAEDPPSRTRRLVTNLRLHETAVPGEYLAQSYLLIVRNRGDAQQFDIFAARRDDVLHRTEPGWQLTKRTVLVDQSVLGMANLAIFI